MLKIKNNIYLSTLIKYGYHELEKVYCKVVPIYKGDGDARVIKISKTNRKIYCYGGYYDAYLTDKTLKKYISELINDNLVEEVR